MVVGADGTAYFGTRSSVLFTVNENERGRWRFCIPYAKINSPEKWPEAEKREGADIPVETIHDVLIKLSRGDLLEYLELGGWFPRVKDPILLEFLKVWGKSRLNAANSRIG